jgi:hypothetical protein
MADSKPGDIEVEKLSVSSSRGSLDLSKAFVSCSIYESIFTPGIVGDISVLDADDQVGQLKITGDENVEFSFKVPGGETANYKFALHTLEDGKMTGSQKSKVYVLKVVSEEALHSKTNFVQKSYKKTISDMVHDIFTTYMKSQKTIDTEDTQGVQDIVISHKNPYEAIDMVRKRATSADNKSSAFVFFETRKGGNQHFIFSTIEKLFKESPVKTFKQSDTVNSDSNNQTDNNIIAYKVPKQLSSTERIEHGGKRRVSTFDFRTHEYKTADKKTDPSAAKSGGSGSYDSAAFKSKYHEGAKIPPQAMIPVDTSQRAVTNIADKSADQQAYLAQLMQNAMHIRVPGDTKLKAGDVVKADIPKKVSTTGDNGNDTQLSGNFLISRIHHEVQEAGIKPRYTCCIEMLKGGMETGV